MIASWRSSLPTVLVTNWKNEGFLGNIFFYITLLFSYKSHISFLPLLSLKSNVDAATSHSSKWICGNNCEASMMACLKLFSPQKFALHIEPTPQLPPPSGHNWLRIQNFVSFFFFFFFFSASSMVKANSVLCSIHETLGQQRWCKFLTHFCIHLLCIYRRYCTMMHLEIITLCGMAWEFYLYTWPRLWHSHNIVKIDFCVSVLWWRHWMTSFSKSSPKWH